MIIFSVLVRGVNERVSVSLRYSSSVCLIFGLLRLIWPGQDMCMLGLTWAWVD